MPKPYPDPSINSTLDMLEYANTVTSGWMSVLFLLVGSIIIFITLKVQGYRTSDSLTVAFFLSFILGSLLWAGGLVAGKIVIFFMLLMTAAGIYSAFDK